MSTLTDELERATQEAIQLRAAGDAEGAQTLYSAVMLQACFATDDIEPHVDRIYRMLDAANPGIPDREDIRRIMLYMRAPADRFLSLTILTRHLS